MPAARLVEDGRGYRTPLQEINGDSIPGFLRREVARLPRRPRYNLSKPRPLYQPRPAPTQHPPRSLVLTTIHILIAAILIGLLVFYVLARLGRILSPDLPPIAAGIVPYGPRILCTFALYATTGLGAGCGVAYWLLRQSQD